MPTSFDKPQQVNWRKIYIFTSGKYQLFNSPQEQSLSEMTESYNVPKKNDWIHDSYGTVPYWLNGVSSEMY